jgi:hypothetical protein
MPTAPIQADGSLGSQDGTPVNTNPIVTPGTPPSYLLPPKNTLANLEGVVDAFLVFLDGSTTTAQLNRNGTIDLVNGS